MSLYLGWHLGCDSPVVPFSFSSIWRLHNFLNRDWECRGCNSPQSLLAEPEPGTAASWVGQMLFLSPLALSELFSLRAFLDLWVHLKCRIAFGGCGSHFPAWLRGTAGFDGSGKVHIPQAVLNISAWKCCLSKLLLDEPCGNSPLIYFLQLLQWVLLRGILENHLEAPEERNEVRLAGRSTLCHITRLDLFFSHCFNLFCSLCRA